MLTDAELTALWESHRTSTDWDKEWHQGFTTWLAALDSLSDEDFVTPDTQRRLWNERGAGTLSWADSSLDLTPLLTDADLAALLLDTRRATWPAGEWPDVGARAAALSARFDEVFARAKATLLAHGKPVNDGYLFARVSRAFMGLTPHDTHSGYVRDKALLVNEAVLGDAHDAHPHEGRVRCCARLTALLGAAEATGDIVRRSTLFWRVFRQAEAAAKQKKAHAGKSTGKVSATAVSGDSPSSSPTPPPAPTWTRPDLATLRARFAADPATARFVFPDGDLAALHHAWHALPGKRFVLLSGLSGTGKTQLLEHYARHYVTGLDSDKHVALVPVSPDWRDEGGLLGWRNPLAPGRFVRGAALDLLLRAAEDADGLPYFLLLDEMNLARVERYFAPLLSAMETGRPLRLHGDADELDGVPPEIPWPTNLFVGGTVNVDESTYPFSDKVLDRAFTFEFWDVDLPGFFARAEVRDEAAEALLLSLHDALRPTRRHFGYRTAREVVAFVAGAAPTDRAALLDRAILAKILPKVRGEEGDGARDALEKVRALCVAAGLARSAEKCTAMLARLAHAGMTGFF